MSKKVLVVGYSKSGKAAINLLKHYGYQVTLTCLELLDEPTKQSLSNIDIVDGGHPLNLLEGDYEFIVKNPGIPYFVPFIKEAKAKGFKIITEIELGYLYSKNTNLAITGTNGKTTVTTLIYNMIKDAYDNTYLAGNIGFPLCDVVLEHPSGSNIVMEVSSFQLMGCYEFKPYISTIMNLSPDHLDFNESLEEYYLSKNAIYQKQDINDYFIRNLDDDNVSQYVTNVQATTITLSLEKEADVMVKDGIIYFKEEPVLPVSSIQVVGKHNIYNVMFAVAYAKLMNVDNTIIEKQVKLFSGVEYRLEKVYEDVNVYYNDSKSTTPDSTLTAMKAFDKDTVLILGGKDKGLDLNELIDFINQSDSIIGVMTYGEIKNDFGKITKSLHTFDTLSEVVAYIKENYKGINVLFSPATSSFDQYKNYEARGQDFNQLVKED